MESVPGLIKSVNRGKASVEVSERVLCRRCAAGTGCGAALFGSGDTRREIEIDIPRDMKLQPGDSVSLSIAPQHLLRAALYAYGLPLASMLVCAGLSLVLTSGSDGAGIAAATTGLIGGAALARHLIGRTGACEQFLPVLGTRSRDL